MRAVSAAQALRSSVVGDLRLYRLESDVFANTRWLRVLLPEGYESRSERRARYPVL